MSLNSLRLPVVLALALAAGLVVQTETLLAQPVQRTFNGSASGLWLDENNWTSAQVKWAGNFDFPDTVTFNGFTDDLAFFGSTSRSTVVIHENVSSGILGAISFNSTNAYSLQTTINSKILSLGGLQVNTTTGSLASSGNRFILVLASNSTGDVTFGGGSSLGLDLKINTDSLNDQAGIFVGSGRTMTLNSIISGSTASKGITLSGGGTLSLTRANTFTGTTIIDAGILSLATGGSLADTSNVTVNGGTLFMGVSDTVRQVILASGTIAGTGELTGTQNFDLRSGTVSAVLNGSVGVNKTTTGTVILSAANKYSGVTNVQAGVLNIRNVSALGATGGSSGTTVSSGAALEVQGNISVGVESLTLNGTGVSSGGALRNFTGNNSWAGGITLGSATQINSDADTLTLSGIISGNQQLTFGGLGNVSVTGAIQTGTLSVIKEGLGNLTLSGANTYTGTTTINAGKLIVSGGAAISNAGQVALTTGATFQLNGSETIGSLIGDGGTVALQGNVLTVGDSSNTTYAGAITGTGQSSFVKVGGGTLTLTGSNSSFLGSTSVNDGKLAGNTSSLVGAITVAAGKDLEFNQTANGTFSGDIEGSGMVFKSGGGTLTLNGAALSSGFTGGINVSEGTLELASSTSMSAGFISVSNATLDVDGTLTTTGAGIWNQGGSFLKGAGTIAGNVLIDTGATLTPGNSIDTLIINGNLDLQGIYEFEFNQTLLDADLTVVSGAGAGNLDLAGGFLSLTQLDLAEIAAGTKFTLFAYSGALTGFFANENDFSADWFFNYSDTAAGLNGNGGLTGGTFVTITAVPEPSAALVLGGLLAGAACLRRRRVA